MTRPIRKTVIGSNLKKVTEMFDKDGNVIETSEGVANGLQDRMNAELARFGITPKIQVNPPDAEEGLL